MGIVLGAVRLAIGILMGAACAFALSPALASMYSEAGNSAAPTLTFAIIGAVAVAGLFAPTIRRAFGRGFLLFGLCLLALPLSAALLSGRAATEVVNATATSDQGFAVIGAGLGAMAVTGAATFLGLILGPIFLILGFVLVLGGRREVIVIDSRQSDIRRQPTVAPARREPPISARR